VALIHRGTTPEQETLISTLDALAALPGPVPLPPPVTAVIGDVVALRKHLGVARLEGDTVATRFDALRPLPTLSERI
jgi:hypothetical protein